MSGSAVMLQEPFAHIARGNADNGVIGGIIRRRTSEQGDPDNPFTQIRRVAMQRVLHDMLEENLAAVAALERRAVDDFVEMRTQLGFVFYGFADLGDGSRVRGAVHFTSHA